MINATREQMLDKLLDSYASYYDIHRCAPDEEPLKAVCEFHVHSAKYVLVKKAQLWAADSHEYLYLFSVPTLTEEIYRECEKLAYDRGMALIEPKPGHMYTYLTAMFLCDDCTEEARRAARRCRLYKSFHFSLWGWMDFHTAVLDRSNGRVITNRSGKANAKLLKKMFMKKKRKGVLSS